MLELGADSLKEHEQILNLVGEYKFSDVYLVGEYFQNVTSGKKYSFKSANALLEYFQNNPVEGCTILLKGSRGMGLEKVIEAL
jgi:UDP-N-acetylmuramoyl-tripeptide--D-alanyl-D-alanine ligase